MVWIGRREHATHEPLISSVIVAEVPLDGLSFFSASGLAKFDTETRFRLRAASGSAARGLALLDRLDARLGQKPPRRRPRSRCSSRCQKPGTSWPTSVIQTLASIPQAR
jgi:hypothetical protein